MKIYDEIVSENWDAYRAEKQARRDRDEEEINAMYADRYRRQVEEMVEDKIRNGHTC
jgi:hypothetical protein